MSSDLRRCSAFGIAGQMKPPEKQDREARLAEALRANLRRRKGAEPKAPPRAPNYPKPAD
jgi:hypothetical protein